MFCEGIHAFCFDYHWWAYNVQLWTRDDMKISANIDIIIDIMVDNQYLLTLYKPTNYLYTHKPTCVFFQYRKNNVYTADMALYYHYHAQKIRLDQTFPLSQRCTDVSANISGIPSLKQWQTLKIMQWLHL